MNTESLFKQWAEKGFRITPVRRAIVGFFMETSEHLSVPAIAVMLKKKGMNPNKTTLYRELRFLESQGFINEVRLPGKKMFYEMQKNHHHHLKCRVCDSVFEIDTEDIESIIKKAQDILLKKTSYRDIGHSLEFYGVCPKCS